MGFVGDDGRYYADPELGKSKADKAVAEKRAAVEAEKTKKNTEVVDKDQHPFAGEPTIAEGLKANAPKASDKK